MTQNLNKINSFSYSSTRLIKSKIFYLIIFFALVTRIFQINHIENYYFDEQYHVPAVKLIVQKDPSVFEWWHNFDDRDYPLKNDQHAINNSNYDWLHPPLAKYIQAFFIEVIGESSLGWRFGSVVFGLALIVLVMLMGTEMFGLRSGLWAGFLMSMSGLVLVQSRIAMNDIYVSFWMALGLFLYWLAKRDFFFAQDKDILISAKKIRLLILLSGLVLGLGLTTKWSAIFAVSYIFFIEICLYLAKAWKKRNFFKKIGELSWSFYALMAIPFFVYILSYAPMFLWGKNMTDFFDLHKYILNYQINLSGDHFYKSKPMDWMINKAEVWYWTQNEISDGKTANIYLIENPLLVFGWLVAVFASLTFLMIKILGKTFFLRKEKFLNFFDKMIDQSKAKSLFFILGGYFFLFLPWIFSPRITFFYHYLPAVSLACLLLGFWIDVIMGEIKKRNGKLGVFLFIFLILLFMALFAFFYSIWIGSASSLNYSFLGIN